MDGLRPCPYTKYSEDVKAAAVSEYLSGAGSLREISQNIEFVLIANSITGL
jgi:transposase-like protein